MRQKGQAQQAHVAQKQKSLIRNPGERNNWATLQKQYNQQNNSIPKQSTRTNQYFNELSTN